MVLTAAVNINTMVFCDMKPYGLEMYIRVSEKSAVSIFTVEEEVIKTKATDSSITQRSHQTTWCHIPQDCRLNATFNLFSTHHKKSYVSHLG
jgi:hypothetical protein